MEEVMVCIYCDRLDATQCRWHVLGECADKDYYERCSKAKDINILKQLEKKGW